jgi:hypothetical protein
VLLVTVVLVQRASENHFHSPSKATITPRLRRDATTFRLFLSTNLELNIYTILSSHTPRTMECRQQHENVGSQLQDDVDESSTEVDDSLMGDEKGRHPAAVKRPAKRSRRRTTLTTLSGYRWAVDTALLLTILGLLVRDQMRSPTVNPLDFNGDLTGVGPKCELFPLHGTLLLIKRI